MKPLDPLDDDDELTRQARRAADLPDAPAAMISKATALMPARPRISLSEVAHSALRLVSAVLSFDSWAQSPAVLGMRAASSDTRHLLFSAQGRDIDLRISPATEHFALSGQILGPDESGVVELAGEPAGGARTHATRLDTLGEFRLDGVRPGRYRLTLCVGADKIVLPPIEVGATC